MAFASVPLSSLVVDGLSSFTSATIRQLRDNLTDHDHTSGKGKRLVTDSIADAVLTGAKFVAGEAQDDRLFPTVVRALEDQTDLAITADDTTNWQDSRLSLSFTAHVPSVVELVYVYQRVEPSLAVSWLVSFMLNGVFQVGRSNYHNSGVIIGQTWRWLITVGAGSHTIVPAWNSVGVAGGGTPIFVRQPRLCFAVVWSQ